MQMKTFRAATSTAAFEKIKAELGNDAIILSNKTVTENGCKCCEIVAAVDAPVKPRSEAKPRTRDDVVEDALQSSVGWQREWSQIKGQIMALMKNQVNLDELSPKQKLAMEYLEREAVDDKVMAHLFCRLREDRNSSIVTALESMARTVSFGSRNWSNVFHAFAGPGGAGKTATLVRLALREKRRTPKCVSALQRRTADAARDGWF